MRRSVYIMNFIQMKWVYFASEMDKNAIISDHFCK